MGQLSTSKDLQSYSNRPDSSPNKGTFIGSGRVTRVYYDYTTENDRPIAAGNIKFKFNTNTSSEELIAYPYQFSFIDLPSVGELVEIYIISTKRYYRRLFIDTETGRNQLEKRTDPTIKTPPVTSNRNYKNPSVSSNINKASVNVDKQKGTRFVHKLSLNPGDTLIQSDFGQTIRLGSFQPSQEKSFPLLILRNRESSKNTSIPKSETVKEDINFDGSTIAMTSGEYISPFTPGTPDDIGNTNFQIDVRKTSTGGTPTYGFEGYPSSLTGDQIIITSDRLVFSSRVNETIFWSKGSAGFITDSLFSVDALNGMTFVSHNGDIDIEAKEKNMTVNVGRNGKIFLGAGEGKALTPAVDGEGLLNLLGEILDEIENLCLGGVLTPAGPASGINPTNKASIGALRNRLASLQSKTVYISK